MTHKPPFPEDLAIVARQRRLSVEESARLHELEGDPAEAALARAGRAFDAQDVESNGDAALAIRMAEHALAGVRLARDLPRRTQPHTNLGSRQLSSRGAGWRPRNRGILIATAVVVAAAAAAATGAYVARTQSTSQRAALALYARPSPPKPAARPGGGAPSLADESWRGPEAEETPAPATEEPQVAEPPGSARAKGDASLSAEQLFSRGNGSRRAGQVAEATTNYEQLLRSFPNSSEAQMARVSLGNLLLDQGQAARALGLFDAHLARGSRLAEEALYGKARALRALGKLTQEREVWQTLATKYPDSIYARSARERLGQGQ